MYRGLSHDTRQAHFLAAVLLVLLVLIALLVVLSLLLILILLLIHDEFLRNVVMRILRSTILSQNSGFILCPENDTCDQATDDGRSDPAGGGFQAAGEDPNKTFFVHSLTDTLG